MLVHENPYFVIKKINDYYAIDFTEENVIIVPVVNSQKYLFIKAKRPIFDNPTIEFPAGGVNKGEGVRDAALREFFEETGIKVKDPARLVELPKFNPLPSRTTQMINIFQLDLTQQEYDSRLPHDEEVDGLLLLTPDEVIRKIKSGEIFVAMVIALFFFDFYKL